MENLANASSINMMTNIYTEMDCIQATKVSDAGDIEVTYKHSKVKTNLTPEEFQRLSSEGEAALLAPPKSGATGIISLADLDERIKDVIYYRLAYVEELVNADYAPKTKHGIQPIINQVAAKHKHEKKPNWNTAYRWWRDYESSEGDILALMPEYDKRGAKGLLAKSKAGNTSVLPALLQRIVVKCIEEHYLKRTRKSLTKVYEILEVSIADQNRLLLLDEQLKIPHINTIRNFIEKNYDPYEVDKARYGKAYADNKYKPRGKGPSPERPLQRVEIDSTPLDIFVLDDETSLLLGRPTFTPALCKATRCITGMDISFGRESWLTTSRCLKHAMLPKTGVREKYNLEHDWFCQGKMETLVIDNGKAYKNNSMVEACIQLKINLILAPPRVPQFKGTIERFFKDQNVLFHGIPGTTFSNYIECGDYPSEKDAIIWRSDLERILHLWIVDVYHQEIHEGLNGIPAQVWCKKIEQYPLPSTPDSVLLDILLGQVMTRKVSRNGIEAHGGLFYNSTELNVAWRKHENRGSALIRFDPDDIGFVYFKDQSTGEFLQVPCTDPNYANGLSLFQHKYIRKYAKQVLRASLDTKLLLKARGEIQRTIEKALQRKKKLNKKDLQFRNDGVRAIGQATADTSILDAILQSAEKAPKHSELEPTKPDGADDMLFSWGSFSLANKQS